MAYLHCHKCGWSQDDFWNWKWRGFLQCWKWLSRPFGYNPVSLILEDIATYLKPRIIKFDSYAAKDMGFKSSNIFSWKIMLWSICRNARRLVSQRWWFYDQWKRDYKNNKAKCPRCQSADDFDID